MRLKARSCFYGCEKTFSRFRATEVCGVVDGIEMTLESQVAPNVLGAMVLLNRCEVQLQATSAKLTQLMQQILVDVGILLKPIFDKGICTDSRSNPLQSRDKSRK